ncbi:MAG: DUF4064 domain-containing protein [Candidatus Thermoplasmatota archaeon]
MKNMENDKQKNQDYRKNIEDLREHIDELEKKEHKNKDKTSSTYIPQNNKKNLYETKKQPVSTNSKPFIAGLLLIIGGITSLIFWGYVVLTIENTIAFMDMSQFGQLPATVTEEQIKNVLVTCGTIAAVLSIFPILGGILSIKNKKWELTLICAILGLFTIGFAFTSSLLALVALVLLFISKDEFKKKQQQ